MNRRTIRFAALTLGAVAAAALNAPLAAQAAETAPAAQATDLPSADAVLTKYIKALGGEKAIREHNSMTMTGRMEIPSQGMGGDIIIRAAAPNRFLVTMTIAGMGEMRQGYDGKVGWAMNPMMGSMLIEDEMLEDLKREADFYADLNYKKNYKTMEVEDKTEFNGKQCYKLRLVSHNDQETTEYFDVENGLKVGGSSTSETPMGPMETVAVVQEYKDFDGVKVPTKLVIKQMGMEQMMTISSVSFAALDPTTFELPAEIKALASEPATQPDGQ
ncbi:MAG: hypothetical protein ACYTJ0_13925 [Planctomycetota bacterium]|jgi:hypothetical protein